MSQGFVVLNRAASSLSLLLLFTYIYSSKHSGVKKEKGAFECTNHLLRIIWALSYDFKLKKYLVHICALFRIMPLHKDQKQARLRPVLVLQSNSVITNTLGPSKNVCYNTVIRYNREKYPYILSFGTKNRTLFCSL